MAAVDPGYADWLRGTALIATETDATFATRWGERARETEIISALALKAGATAEAARQFAFLKGPNVIDRHVVPGQRRDLIGRVVTLRHASLGYAAGVDCFVLQYEEGEAVTTLTVLRPL